MRNATFVCFSYENALSGQPTGSFCVNCNSVLTLTCVVCHTPTQFVDTPKLSLNSQSQSSAAATGAQDDEGEAEAKVEPQEVPMDGELEPEPEPFEVEPDDKGEEEEQEEEEEEEEAVKKKKAKPGKRKRVSSVPLRPPIYPPPIAPYPTRPSPSIFPSSLWWAGHSCAITSFAVIFVPSFFSLTTSMSSLLP